MYQSRTDNHKTKPPENVVTKDVLKPFHKINGATFEISGITFIALFILIPVISIPNIPVSEPISIILST